MCGPFLHPPPGFRALQAAADRALLESKVMAEIDEFLDGIDSENEGEAGEAGITETGENTTGENTDEVSSEGDSTPESEETQQDKSKRELGLEAGIAAERGNRQKLEDENRQLKASLDQYQTTAAEKKEDLDFFEDPNAAREAMRDEFNEKLITKGIEFSEEIARSQHEDFDEKIGDFIVEANQNPELWDKFKQAKMPAVYAYKHATKQRKMKELESTDIVTLEAKIRADERAKGEEATKKAVQAALAQAGKLPQSMATERAAGGNGNPEWGGPPSIDDMLNN